MQILIHFLRMLRWPGCVLLFCASLCCGRAETLVAPEYKLKAAFLYNFAVLTEWPAGTFVSKNAPFTIGVIGTDPFGQILEETVRGKTIGGRKIAVARYQRAEEIQHCQILFISSSERADLMDILHSIEGQPVLTVSEMIGFNLHGGMISFRNVDDEIKFRVRYRLAEKVGLKLSSRLLALALDCNPNSAQEEEGE